MPLSWTIDIRFFLSFGPQAKLWTIAFCCEFAASEPWCALISINVGIFVYVLTFVYHWTPINLEPSSMIGHDIHRAFLCAPPWRRRTPQGRFGISESIDTIHDSPSHILGRNTCLVVHICLDFHVWKDLHTDWTFIQNQTRAVMDFHVMLRLSVWAGAVYVLKGAVSVNSVIC